MKAAYLISGPMNGGLLEGRGEGTIELLQYDDEVTNQMPVHSCICRKEDISIYPQIGAIGT